MWFVVRIGLLLLVTKLGTVAAFADQKKIAPQPTPKTTEKSKEIPRTGVGTTPDITLTGKGFYGCVNMFQSYRFAQLLQHDAEAALMYYRPLQEVGTCTRIDEGTRVAIEDRFVLKDEAILYEDKMYYCVRPWGDPRCYWLPASTLFKDTGGD